MEVQSPGPTPQAWQVSVRPVVLSSYMSRVSCVGKVIEKIVNTRLEWYLEKYNVYKELMAGFQRKRSLMHSVIDLEMSLQHQKLLK